MSVAQALFTLEMFNKAIEEIVRAQARANTAIGKALLMALYFSLSEDDLGAANALLKCLRKSTKMDAIVKLLETHGNMAYTKKGFIRFEQGTAVWPEDKKGVDSLRAVCNDWESYKVGPKPVESIDLFELIDALVKKVESANKNGVKIVHGDLLLEINKAKALMVAKQYQ